MSTRENIRLIARTLFHFIRITDEIGLKIIKYI